MICEACNKNPATVYLSKIVNGNQVEMYLCETCAKEKGSFNLDSNFSIQNFLTHLIKSTDQSAFRTEEAINPKVVACPNCGLTYQEFRKIGKFGCSECYQTFGQLIKPILKKIQGNAYHAGKIPLRTGKLFKTKQVIGQLQEALKNAIEEEAYEKAANLRDEIKRLKNEGGI